MKYLWSFLTATVVVTCIVPAHAQTYSAIYIFGDSLCDTGNMFFATNGTLPVAPYYEGRFSNGPLWIEQFAATFKLPVTPVLEGGSNYAFGGAQVLSSDLIPSIAVQVEAYLSLHWGRADPKALYIVEGGINDVLGSNHASSSELGVSIARALSAIEVQLNEAGATHFLVVNLPDVGLLPVAGSSAGFDSSASVSANPALKQLIETDQESEGIRIDVLDLYSLGQSVIGDPSRYGFANVTSPCLSSTNEVCADPARTFFWDAVHPTTAGYVVIAAAAEGLIHP